MCLEARLIRAAVVVLLFSATRAGKLRVVVDTDIGDDIDDTWALALLLADADVDVRLIVADSYLPEKRAEVLARFLRQAGRAPPIAVGPGCCQNLTTPLVLDGWAGPSDLLQYAGTVSWSAVSAIIDEVALGAAAGETTKVVVLSPCHAVAGALQRAPWIAEHIEVHAMGGSLRIGDNGSGPPYAEWNVHADVASARALYGAAWRKAAPRLAPLDTAGLAQVGGAAFQTVRRCTSPLARALRDMNAAWLPRCPWRQPLWGPQGLADESRLSSVIYDAVAASSVVLAGEFLAFENLRIGIRSTGLMVIDPTHGHRVSAAMHWTDLSGWEVAVARLLCTDHATASPEVVV